eukprot:SAG22_NODE_1226_length_5115_cov_1.930024_2_plen_298_part_00
MVFAATKCHAALNNPNYRPSFSTAVLEETRLIRIRRSQYRQMVDGKPITDFKSQTASEAAKAGEQAASASPRNRSQAAFGDQAVRRSLTRSDSSGNLKFAASMSRVQRKISEKSLSDEAAADARASAEAKAAVAAAATDSGGGGAADKTYGTPPHIDTPRVRSSPMGGGGDGEEGTPLSGPLFPPAAAETVDNPLNRGGGVIEESSFEGSDGGGSERSSADSPRLSAGSGGASPGGRRRLGGRLQKVSSADDEDGQSGDDSPSSSPGPLQLGQPADIGQTPHRPMSLTLEAEAEEEI